MEAWNALHRRCADIPDQLRRLKWLALWLIVKYSMDLWFSALISEEAKR